MFSCAKNNTQKQNNTDRILQRERDNEDDKENHRSMKKPAAAPVVSFSSSFLDEDRLVAVSPLLCQLTTSPASTHEMSSSSERLSFFIKITLPKPSLRSWAFSSLDF